MKILINCRLMSGFKSSIIESNWNPSGSPAIYKLIEKFVKDNDEVSIIFTARESGFYFKDMWEERRDKKFKIKGVKAIQLF